MMAVFTRTDLAGETGVSPALIAQLAEIGVLTADEEGKFVAGDIIRIEAVKSFLDAGLPLDVLAEAIDQGLFTFEFLDRFHPEPASRSEGTIDRLAADLDLPWEVLVSVYVAMGLPEPSSGHVPRRDEESLLRRFVEAWGTGGEDALIRAARLVGEPARLLSEGWTRLYVEKISDPMAAAQMPMEERISAIVETTEKATSLAPEMFHWLMQRHLRHAIDRANFEGLEEAMTSHGLAFPVRSRVPAVAFVDVSGYTTMTERLGDDRAVLTSAALRDRALAVSRRHGGSVVKLLGDGAMLHFSDVIEGVAAVMELMEGLDRNEMTAHAGINAGAMIEYDGDFYGRTVNLAARVADRAGPREVLVTDAVVEADASGRFSYQRLDPLPLKGISAHVPVHRVARATS